MSVLGVAALAPLIGTAAEMTLPEVPLLAEPSKQGAPTGAAIVALAELQRRTGVSFQYRILPSGRYYKQLEMAGDSYYMAIVGSYVPPQSIVLGDTFPMNFVAVGRAGEPPPTLELLKRGKLVAVPRRIELVLPKDLREGVAFVEVPNSESGLRMVASGRADIYMGVDLTLASLVQKLGLEAQLGASLPLAKGGIGIFAPALLANSGEADKIRAGWNAMLRDGSFAAILQTEIAREEKLQD